MDHAKYALELLDDVRAGLGAPAEETLTIALVHAVLALNDTLRTLPYGDRGLTIGDVLDEMHRRGLGGNL